MSPLLAVLLRAAGVDLVKRIVRWIGIGKEARAMEGTKAWWESRGVIGPMVSTLAFGLKLAFGMDIGEAEQAALIDGVLNLVVFGGALLGVWGRIMASKRIG